MTERHDDAVTAWTVTPDGTVRVALKPSDSAPSDKAATATVVAKPAGGAASGPIPLTYDSASGLHTGKIPALSADITEVSYEGTVGGKPIKGTLHLPKGGTDELINNGKAASGKVGADKKGPNGGVVQVVGDDVIEIASDKNGEVRVYVLDDSLKPVAVGSRKIKLAVAGSSSEVVELVADPGGAYFKGKLSIKVNPTKVTIIVQPKPEATPVVVLAGWNPGTVVVVGKAAPTVNLFVINAWSQTQVTVVTPPAATVIVQHKGKGKGHGKGHKK
ncbi:MAG: hypothetical protein U0165_12430 [Polyangiaceae bacterium]